MSYGFEFCLPTKVEFGRDAHEKTGALVKESRPAAPIHPRARHRLPGTAVAAPRAGLVFSRAGAPACRSVARDAGGVGGGGGGGGR